MKTLLLVIAAMLPISASAQVEHPTGCVWQKDGGKCYVFNETVKPLKCDVYIKHGPYTSVKKVVVAPKMDRDFVVPGKAGQVTIRAICE